MVKRWMLLIVLFSLLSICVNAEVNYTYQINQDSFNIDVYNCGSDCIANTNPNFISTFTASGNTASINLNPSSYLAVFYKDCFMPFAKQENVADSIENTTIVYGLAKKNGCNAVLDSPTIVGSKLVNESVTISSNLKSVYSLADYGLYDYLGSVAQPSRAGFFKGRIIVDFYVNDELVNSGDFNLGANELQSFSFIFTPNKKGTYNLRIVSRVDDCKCTGSLIDSKEIAVTINEVYVQQVQQVTKRNATIKKGETSAGTKFLPFSGSCSSDGLCNTNCIGGDSDCSCANQNGYTCKENQECTAKILRNWDEVLCCSHECVSSNLSEKTNGIKALGDINLDKNETYIPAIKSIWVHENGFQYSIALIIIALILFSIFVSFTLHHFGDEVGFVVGTTSKIFTGTREYFHFLSETGKSAFGRFKISKKDVKENVKKESPKKVIKLNPLILKILDTLYGDEETVFKIVLDSDGVKKDDIREQLGWDRIRMEQALIKLERKQVVKLKGVEDNPKIYVHDWLK